MADLDTATYPRAFTTTEASQRAFLSIGAWLSQQQVRDATFNCGGHDAETTPA